MIVADSSVFSDGLPVGYDDEHKSELIRVM